VPYIPQIGRTAREILQRLAAKTVVRSQLTDVAETGVAMAQLQSIAEELEFYDRAILGYRDGYTFNAHGRMLDRRVAELPRGGITRLGPAAATGRSIRVRRADTIDPLTVPAGSTYARADNPDILYVQTEQVVIPAGQEWYPLNEIDPGIPVVCQRRGAIGNAAPGTVTIGISIPDAIVEVTQPKTIAGGLPRESDAQLRHRASLYLASLVGVQPDAIEFRARTFETTDGARFAHVSIWEDPERPAYTEVIVDDGAGFAGEQKPGPLAGGTIPENGQRILYFESPAVDASPDTFKVYKGLDNLADLYGADSLPYTVIEERGVLYVAEGVYAPGDFWSITDYKVYTGAIRDFQRVIEGRPLSVFAAPGARASGTRVRVVPPRVQWVSFKLGLLFEQGISDLVAVRAAVKDAIVQYLSLLPPGEPALLKRIACAILSVRGVRTFDWFLPTTDIYPGDFRTALRTQYHLIEVV